MQEALGTRIARTRRTFGIWATLMAAAVRGTLQYRMNFVTSMVGVALMQSTSLAFVAIVVTQFGAIGGWGMGEIALLYGMRTLAHAVFTVPFAGLHRTSQLVRMGEFDRLLVRPVNPFVQVISWRWAVMTSGDLLAGIGILAAATFWAPVEWSVLTVGYLLLAVLGGAMVELALNLVISGLTFRVLTIRSAQIVVDQMLATFGGYPLSIFPVAVRFALTLVLPLAFVAYIPATVLLGRTDELAVQPWLAAWAPLVGLLLTIAAYRFWQRQTRHYNSPGH